MREWEGEDEGCEKVSVREGDGGRVSGECMSVGCGA